MAHNAKSELWNYFTNIPEEGMAECNICKHRLRNNRSNNLKNHLINVHDNRKEIDKFFDIHFSENIAVCKICKERTCNRIRNLRWHMKSSHNIEVDVRKEKTDQIQSAPQVAKRRINDQLSNNEICSKRRLHIKMDQNTIIRGAIGLIVEDGASLNLFSSKHFNAVLRPMCEAISDTDGEKFSVDETKIERLISLIANYIRKDFSNDLHCRLLSITIDTDLNASPNTFCISAQFITDGEIQKRILGIIALEHDHQLKEEHIKQILYKYNIDSNQIIGAFCGNTKEKYNNEVKNSEYLKEIEQCELCPDLYLGDVKIKHYLGTKAQLCLLDILKNPNIFLQFLQCRNLAKFFSNECNGYFELFDLNNLKIPQVDSPWKPGSTFEMMNDLRKARGCLNNVKIEPLERPEDQFNLNEDLWLFIESFCESTKYLQKSILKYYNEELHISDFYAQWLKCKLLTENVCSHANKQNDLLSMILEEVLRSIGNRTEELLNQDYIVACLYLDPRFQHILNPNQYSNAVAYLKKLWCRAKLYIDGDSESLGETGQLFDVDEDSSLNEFMSHDAHVKDKESRDVFNKIESLKLEFQMADTSILLFWKKQNVSDPVLHTLSSICFAIPATEIYSKIRYSNFYPLNGSSEMSAFTKENLVNIRVNVHLLDEALSHLQLTNDDRSIASSYLSDSETESHNISDDTNSITGSIKPTHSGIAQES